MKHSKLKEEKEIEIVNIIVKYFFYIDVLKLTKKRDKKKTTTTNHALYYVFFYMFIYVSEDSAQIIKNKSQIKARDMNEFGG